MKRTSQILSLFTVGLVLAVYVATHTTAPDPVLSKYQSIPKGVTLEGRAIGVESLTSITFDRRSNTFTINGAFTYANPVSASEFLELYDNVRGDDRLGVSVVIGRPKPRLTYGQLNPKSQMAIDLTAADNFLVGVVRGRSDLIGRARLPGGYRPQHARRRSIPTLSYFNFENFVFQKLGTQYQRQSCRLEAKLYVQSMSASSGGGFLPDMERTQRGDFHPEDVANVAHINANNGAYIQIPVLSRAAAIGEAAAFARHLRDSGLDSRTIRSQFR